MSNAVETDMYKVFDQFAELTVKEMTAAVKRALKKGAQALRKQTVSNMEASFNSTARNPLYSDRITDAARVSKVSADYGEDMEVKVHIMGTQKSGSGTYRARFFENGTVDRYAKTWRGKPLTKQRYLGRLQSKGFFTAANSSVLPSLPSMYMTEIDKAIQKMNKE